MPEERTLLLAGAEYPPLDGGGPTQRISGDTVATFEPGSWRGAQALRPLEPLPMQNPRFTPDLAPEPRFSWDDPALGLRADSIRNGTTNAREAAIALQGWVHGHITLRDPVHETGMRPAGLVLASGSGTPEELAVLTVALARRMGLPARLAGGILLTAHGIRRHSWAEVFIGDWVPVDPCQSSLTASPSHIRLVAGGTGAWADLLPLAAAYVGTTAPRELP
jgi:transglutaminase-like putative cysteine protease